MAGKLNTPSASPFIPLSDVDPRLFSFAVLVEPNKVTAQLLAALTPQVTTYRAFAQLPGVENARVEEPAGEGLTLGDNWVYAFHEEGQYHQFVFVKMRSDVEAQKPIEALSYTTVDLYPWPDVLIGLWFVEDKTQPFEVIQDGRVSYIPKLFPRKQMVPGGTYPTKFRVEIFASHKRFEEGFFALDVPSPTGVYWSTRNTSGSIPACLHDEVTIPEGNPNGNVWFGAGMKGSKIDFGSGTFIPKTNHRRWRNHVCHEGQQQVKGVWLLERRMAIVPRGASKLMKD